MEPRDTPSCASNNASHRKPPLDDGLDGLELVRDLCGLAPVRRPRLSLVRKLRRTDL